MEELNTLIARAKVGDLGAYGGIVQRFQDMAMVTPSQFLGTFILQRTPRRRRLSRPTVSWTNCGSQLRSRAGSAG